MPPTNLPSIRWHIPEKCSKLKVFLESNDWPTMSQLVKRNHRRSIYQLSVPDLGGIFYLKHDHPRTLRNRIKSLWRYKERAELNTGLKLQERGVRTVPIIGWGAKNPDSVLVTGMIPGTQSSLEVWSACRQENELRIRFIDQFAIFLQSMVQGGVYHYDFHPGNILASTRQKDGWFFLVDFSNISFRSSVNSKQKYRFVRWLEGM